MASMASKVSKTSNSTQANIFSSFPLEFNVHPKMSWSHEKSPNKESPNKENPNEESPKFKNMAWSGPAIGVRQREHRSEHCG